MVKTLRHTHTHTKPLRQTMAISLKISQRVKVIYADHPIQKQ